jgi:membrane fusion protein, multidrug efflux system
VRLASSPALLPHAPLSFAPARKETFLAYLKQVISAAMVLLAAAGGYAAYDQLNANRPQPETRGEGRSAPAIAVETAEAEPREVTSSLEAVGSSLARQSIEVVALASGRVREIGFEPGQRVAAGDVLLKLDDEIERADLAQAEASLREATLSLERAETLRRQNAVSQSALDEAQTRRATAEANLDRANRRLADRTVRAPFDGIVGLRRIDAGARVSDTTVITTLDDLSEIEIEFSVSETLYGRIALGQTVVATAAAYPERRFEGAVSSIDSRIDPAGRSFKVRASLPNEDLALPAGMYMHVTLNLDRRMAVVVPETAIVPIGGKSYVYVINNGLAEQREVAVGDRQPGTVEVSTGLEVGDVVVVSGTQRLRNGAPVNVVARVGDAG